MFNLKQLEEFWNPNVERCGLILDSGEIIEVPNRAADPTQDFSFPLSYFQEHPNTAAVWHTHPNGNPNLSVPDYQTFLKHPSLFHYIVGNGKVWGYYVKENRVFLYEEDSL